jgi:hypothetical protein
LAQLYKKHAEEEATTLKGGGKGAQSRYMGKVSRKISLLRDTLSVLPKVGFGIVRIRWPFSETLYVFFKGNLRIWMRCPFSQPL